jgi:hypothetical protein
VYPATGDPTGSPVEYLGVGDRKGNVGDQNYEIAADVGIDTTVSFWGVRFSVAFGAALLAKSPIPTAG